jgi:hypothetical protein
VTVLLNLAVFLEQLRDTIDPSSVSFAKMPQSESVHLTLISKGRN